MNKINRYLFYHLPLLPYLLPPPPEHKDIRQQAAKNAPHPARNPVQQSPALGFFYFFFFIITVFGGGGLFTLC